METKFDLKTFIKAIVITYKFYPKTPSFSASTQNQRDKNMNPISLFFLFLLSLALLCIARGQERAPHGLVYESPVAFSPAAYDFFHPNAQKPETRDPCTASKCSPLPLAAQVDATQIYENKVSATQKGGKQIGAGGVAGIIIVAAFAMLLAMGIYYVKVTRQANMSRANNSVQSHA
ncbi:hypothetical protein VNO78_05684 [Psophocarpus tetragonolobus]|uniref:Transmembrane protein n=1 Tax=Psophocarpus tetragonolobus TaxID=3891 RepID=A0AAN9SR97_PSOTE